MINPHLASLRQWLSARFNDLADIAGEVAYELDGRPSQRPDLTAMAVGVLRARRDLGESFTLEEMEAEVDADVGAEPETVND